MVDKIAHVDVARVAVGDRLPDHVFGPIGRGTLALFAGASNDHMLLHIDSDYAKKAGMADVFAHGMLSMAYVAQLITHWAPQERLREWGVRFIAITPLHATVFCYGEVTDIFELNGERRARLKVGARTGEGVVTLEGDAIISLS